MTLDQFLRRLAQFAALIIVGVLAWIIGSRWNADALALLVGVLFGWLGGIPTALLIITQDRRKRAEPPPPAPREFQLIDPATGQIAPYIMRERLPVPGSEVKPWIAFGSTSSHS